MRHVTVQQIVGPDPEPTYHVVVSVPVRAGEDVLDELIVAVGDAVHAFEQAIPDRTWHSSVTGFFPPGHGGPDPAGG